MPHDVFISYSTHDKAAADATCAALEASGIRCWIAPRDIRPGAEWGEAIVEAITASKVMVLVFSAHANESPQIRREVERAVSKGIAIIPLRIQDIAPARSLEYFIGTVHWLDALTPPLQTHLRRLAESVKALLQIDPVPPRIVPPVRDPAQEEANRKKGDEGWGESGPTGAPASASGSSKLSPAKIAAIALGVCVLLIGIRWLSGAKSPPAEPSYSSPSPQNAMSPGNGGGSVDPALVGTFEFDATIDDYDWRFVLSIAANGTYRIATTQEERGTYQAGNGVFRTVGVKTGRTRTGTYRAVGASEIAVTSATGTAVFRPVNSTPPVDPTNPIMLGAWQSNVIMGGVPWILTIQNNPDGTFRYVARMQDTGSCTYAGQLWRTVSASTGQTTSGTYRVVDAGHIEFTSPSGPTVWSRR
jgi:hypothetical protein